jgi:hypothetical protein
MFARNCYLTCRLYSLSVITSSWRSPSTCYSITIIFSLEPVNEPATSSPADDVHHYVIPQKLLLTTGLYFQQTSGIHAPVGKRKCCSLSARIPAPTVDSFHVATKARKQKRVKFTRN